jgi:di/tricarboxylate transporter
MKKLIILLIIVLTGIFFVNILSNTSKTQEATLASIVSYINISIDSMTRDEINRLAERITTKELEDAKILIKQWEALIKVATEANKIMVERY